MVFFKRKRTVIICIKCALYPDIYGEKIQSVESEECGTVCDLYPYSLERHKRSKEFFVT